MTHRQYLVWRVWKESRWNRPDRHDWYVMALSCQVARLFAKEPKKIQPKDFELKFESPEDQKRIPFEASVARSKHAWGAALGIRTAPQREEE